MSPRSSTQLLIVLAVAIMAGSVWLLGGAQRDAAVESFHQTRAADAMLTAMLDQETGLRGYRLADRETFLQPFRDGERRFHRVASDLRSRTRASDAAVRSLVEHSEELAARWQAMADEAVTITRVEGSDAVPAANTYGRKAVMDRFRAVNGRLQRRLEQRRARQLDRIGTLSVGLILGLSTLFGLGGWLTFGRRGEARLRREREVAAQRERQSEFARSLQFTDTEEDAHRLVKRHLESTIGGAAVVVMQRNNSADRLEAATPLDPRDPLAAALVDAQPRSCLAVRLGGEHRGGADELLECGVCGRAEGERTTCTPLLVQGEVIGSVLVSHADPLGESDRRYVTETVTQAAPVIANMRNLAVAELRAATDALTGLANRRAIQDTLRRMVAQADRTDTPLAAIALDLDHFKAINDRYGHDKGDEVLAAASQVLTGTLRGSDFAGRQGGEEFVALLPDTAREGALVAAENLRKALTRLRVAGVDRAITGSFGVAVYPDDAPDAGALLRQADRALYAAKARGRNCVEASAEGAALSAD